MIRNVENRDPSNPNRGERRAKKLRAAQRLAQVHRIIEIPKNTCLTVVAVYSVTNRLLRLHPPTFLELTFGWTFVAFLLLLVFSMFLDVYAKTIFLTLDLAGLDRARRMFSIPAKWRGFASKRFDKVRLLSRKRRLSAI